MHSCPEMPLNDPSLVTIPDIGEEDFKTLRHQELQK